MRYTLRIRQRQTDVLVHTPCGFGIGCDSTKSSKNSIIRCFKNSEHAYTCEIRIDNDHVYAMTVHDCDTKWKYQIIITIKMVIVNGAVKYCTDASDSAHAVARKRQTHFSLSHLTPFDWNFIDVIPCTNRIAATVITVSTSEWTKWMQWNREQCQLIWCVIEVVYLFFRRR